MFDERSSECHRVEGYLKLEFTDVPEISDTPIWPIRYFTFARSLSGESSYNYRYTVMLHVLNVFLYGNRFVTLRYIVIIIIICIQFTMKSYW